jgi:predicted GNAT family N-acyltransferase
LRGYYTLSACHVHLAELSEDRRRRLPRYPTVPAVRLGRLAVDRNFQKRGLRSVLLANAVARSLESEVAAHLMVVDATDAKAADFYRRHGFESDADDPLRCLAALEVLARGLGLR